ncbi:hypothetical protein A3C59_04710 [Candidatus Daviesbacteria bacterium RIFCSPHIGHO2_02_FULL_36_13]|uniref:Glycosyltransferase RgtA/B/C/D-like domain-containing protein n=1 Tax=Candidatus Daviesbacteria bacterium RIFCSPHIGHO2_02_FULL_36_13 TaxID=1797768 RepID=A0A1F5JNP7_9BACT|nr:MAG: hypothetical protein A3C59_04710 [Candidatus Daviesbacteria bacterium RIFCSPHIGHO2_02_FULL_36_13]
MKFVFSVFLIWRLLLFISTGEFSLSSWANFDGIHYLSIAANGYTFDGRFLPLYPYLIKIFSTPFNFPDMYLYSGLFVSNISFLLSLMLFYKLVKEDYSEKVAKESLIWMLIFPTSFFFVSVYSESLFLFLTLLSFYFAQKSKWVFASIAGFFLGITRLTGMFILPSLIYEFLKKEKSNPLKIFPLFLIPAGLISFAVFCFYKWGDALYFIKAHGDLGNSRSVDSVVFPLQTVYRYSKILFTVPPGQFEYWIALLELSVFIAVSFLIYLGWKKKLNPSWLIFSLLTFLLPSFSGTFSGLPRYVITIFPIFIVLALIKNRLFKISYGLISPVLLLLLLVLFSRGYFVA